MKKDYNQNKELKLATDGYHFCWILSYWNISNERDIKEAIAEIWSISCETKNIIKRNPHLVKIGYRWIYFLLDLKLLKHLK